MPIYKYYTAQGCLAQGFTVLICLTGIAKKYFWMQDKKIKSLGDFGIQFDLLWETSHVTCVIYEIVLDGT